MNANGCEEGIGNCDAEVWSFDPGWDVVGTVVEVAVGSG